MTGTALSSKLMAGASLMLLASVVHGLTRVTVNVVAGRSLGPAEFGQLTLCLAVAQFCAVLGPASLGAATSKYISAQSTERDTASIARGLQTWAAWGAAITSVMAGSVWLMAGDGPWHTLAVPVLLCLAYSQYHFKRGLLLGRKLFNRITAREVLFATTTLGGCGIVLALGGSGLLFASCMAGGFAAFGLGIRPKRAPRIADHLRREILRYTAIATIGSVASVGFLQLSVLAASHWGDRKGVGLFGAALATATPASIFAVSLGSALLPSMSASSGQEDGLVISRMTDRSTRLIFLLAVCLFGAMVIGAEQIVRILWGPSFQGAIPILRVLLIAVMLTSCAVPCVTRLSATSPEKLATATRASIGGVLTSILLWVPLGEGFGVTGIAWGYLIGASGTAIAVFAVCWRLDGHEWGWLAVCTAVAVGLLVGVSVIDPNWSDLDAIFAASTFVIGYAAAMRLPTATASFWRRIQGP